MESFSTDNQFAVTGNAQWMSHARDIMRQSGGPWRWILLPQTSLLGNRERYSKSRLIIADVFKEA